jgi:hypothetical protein
MLQHLLSVSGDGTDAAAYSRLQRLPWTLLLPDGAAEQCASASGVRAATMLGLAMRDEPKRRACRTKGRVDEPRRMEEIILSSETATTCTCGNKTIMRS